MSKEKQIEEMANDIFECRVAIDGIDLAFAAVHGADSKDSHFMRLAEQLYSAGYRKQSEGKWHYNPDGMDWGLGAWECSLCGCRNDNLPMDNKIKPLRWAGSKYCPNCGAKMKGDKTDA